MTEERNCHQCEYYSVDYDFDTELLCMIAVEKCEKGKFGRCAELKECDDFQLKLEELE